MTAYAGDKPILLIKKFTGLALVVFGLLFMATGFNGGYTGLTFVGVVLLAAGLAALVLKIVRRNRDAQP